MIFTFQISFTGIWSRNTHPQQYPENDWVPRYSDLVGASHSADYVLWTPGTLATPGLKDLAEYANSTTIEAEIREKVVILRVLLSVLPIIGSLTEITVINLKWSHYKDDVEK